MERLVLEAKVRDRFGTRHARAARECGETPAIIYGHGEAPQAVTLSRHDLEVELSRGSRTVSLNLDGKREQFLIKEVQYDHLGVAPLHVDLMRVSADERVTITVAIEIKGTPKGLAEGGALDQQMADIELECLVTEIPESIRANVASLGVGETLYVRDLVLPPGVKVLADPDDRVATVRMLVEAAAPAAAPESEESKEPAVIKRERAEAEGEEKEKKEK